MKAIVLATFNSRYHHTALGLRCLRANLPKELRAECRIVEFDLKRPPADVAREILTLKPSIVGLGVYIWNVAQCAALLSAIKEHSPNTICVLGGPEVSYEHEAQPWLELADYVVCGEGEESFAALCCSVFEGKRPTERVLHPPAPDLATAALPTAEYTDEDIAHRFIYLEASRGCPFSCQFCLSALSKRVRPYPLPKLFAALESLLGHGARHLRFVDRTFNLDSRRSEAILEFLLDRFVTGLFLHFEIIPDRLPERLRTLIARFPPGSLQLEAGVQTFNRAVAARIERRQDFRRTTENLRWLRAHTHAHIHADLIVGLPGETEESFARGFDRLLALRPHEIQVGLLKRLRGAPIGRHTAEWQMKYNPDAPYEVFSTSTMDATTLLRLKRFARYWDMVANSGRFSTTLPLIVGSKSSASSSSSPYRNFMQLAEALFRQFGRTHSIALRDLESAIEHHLTAQRAMAACDVIDALRQDTTRRSRHSRTGLRQELHLL